ncbi:MAG: GntR family transcriptional regulator [Zoogloeaceae bacterium]|jgi:GntR family transcriptional regulator|nr:GntR family transcriptional regulator [Zoogloeaceae bacterium]
MSYSNFVILSNQVKRRAKSPNFNPLYRQIKALILQSLSSGEWKPGTMIPSEIELAAQFGVSQGTVRKAIDELSAEKLLLRLQGKGTFVVSHSDEPYRFLRLYPDDGSSPQKHYQPLLCEHVAADTRVAGALACPEGDSVVKVERILLFNDEAVVFDQIFLSGNGLDGLTLDILCQEQRPLYSMLEWRFGVRIIRAREKLRAIAADAEIARNLSIPVGEPLLLVERTASTYDDKTVEWRRSFYRTDRYHYLNELD